MEILKDLVEQVIFLQQTLSAEVEGRLAIEVAVLGAGMAAVILAVAVEAVAKVVMLTMVALPVVQEEHLVIPATVVLAQILVQMAMQEAEVVAAEAAAGCVIFQQGQVVE